MSSKTQEFSKHFIATLYFFLFLLPFLKDRAYSGSAVF